MAQITPAEKILLDKFAESQPALQHVGKLPSAAVKLGTLMEKAISNTSMKATYSFALHGGAVSTITLQAGAIPAGSIVTGVMAETVTAVTSAGSAATIAVVVGSTTVVSAVDAEATFATPGAISNLTTVPAKFSAASALKITIAGEALTAGKVVFYVSYMAP